MRRQFPTREPVLVKTGTPPLGYLGWCESSDDGHLIVIHAGHHSRSTAIDTLAHEYAHALCFEQAPRGDAHSDEWGIRYARVYRWAVSHRAWPRR